MDIPVVGTSFAVGQELYNLLQQGQVTLRLAVDASVEPRTTENVIADTTTGRADRTVVVGSHLDSVPEGPGINDNGSGSATDLEVALQMARLDIQPRNRVRFAFWGAEESGLVGSHHYVDSLTKRQIKDIAVNLNFDMVASPNYVRFVYDGDASDTDSLGSTGSGVVEDVFTDYFDSQGFATEPTAFDGRSDYDAFINVGIPAGGLFTGAEGIKTAEEAAVYGGVAGPWRARRQPQHPGSGRDAGRGRPRHADFRPDYLGGHRHGEGFWAPEILGLQVPRFTPAKVILHHL
jgi:Zn-dependent M28 family amino/carboxypeptidase